MQEFNRPLNAADSSHQFQIAGFFRYLATASFCLSTGWIFLAVLSNDLEFSGAVVWVCAIHILVLALSLFSAYGYLLPARSPEHRPLTGRGARAFGLGVILLFVISLLLDLGVGLVIARDRALTPSGQDSDYDAGGGKCGSLEPSGSRLARVKNASRSCI